MSTPLTANYRISIAYVVRTIPHVWRGYCKRGADLSGIPSVIVRDGSTTIEWSHAAQGAWNVIRQILENETPAPNATLEHRLTGTQVWETIDTAALESTGADTQDTSLASQLTVVLRDTANKKIRFVVLEHSRGYVGHAANHDGFGDPVKSLVKNLDGFVTDDNTIPFGWQVSRANNYIKATGACAGITLDLNDKVKRGRGLE